MTLHHAKFNIGQLVLHKSFNYRGVIADVDPVFLGTEEWYEKIALSKPPKDEPWYKILVHDAEQETYVAERNLMDDPSPEPVDHPLVDAYFQSFGDGCYLHAHDRN